MKVILILCLLAVSLFSVQMQQCTCDQLLSKEDCENMIDFKCIWSLDFCKDAQSYCDKLSQKECRINCAWFRGQCTLFTGCTPFPKKTLEECQAISTKCISDGNHCVEIDKCNLYKTQLSCNYEQNRPYCYWDSNQCSDADTCAKLPLSLTNDNECRNQISSCTTTGKGCIKSGINCIDQQNEQSCVWNLDKTMECIWTNGQCVDKICANAPKDSITDKSCSEFLKTCKTTGVGCMENVQCSDIITEIACQNTTIGHPCFWFEGCQNRTCANAPITILKLAECEAYLPKNNCISKSGGGCVQNTTCDAINQQDACIQDMYGKNCFWNSESKVCINKTCNNAPKSYTNHKSCQNYMKTCTVNFQLQGCVEIACATLLTKEMCLDQRDCQFVGSCYKKQCPLAPTTLISHNDCQNYLNSCTLSSSGAGCVQIPYVCQGNVIENSCYLKAIVNSKITKYGKCIWKGSICSDLKCIDLDKQLNTSKSCDEELEGCVVNDNLQGCMPLPNQCRQRLNSDNCQITRDNYPICLWQNNLCIEKLCNTASQFLQYFTPQSCSTFLKNCTLSADGENCQNSGPCSKYSKETQCSFDQYNNQCYWDQYKCIDAHCDNAPKNGTFITDQACKSYKVNEKVCTVRDYTNTPGCVMRQANCEDYYFEAQCYFNLNGNACLWHNNQCWTKKSFQCQLISLSTYSTINCEQVAYYCKSNNSGTSCDQKLCSDYLKTDGQSTGMKAISKNEECQLLNSQCAINNEQIKKCQTIQSKCSEYSTQNRCTFSTSGQCVWVAGTGKCVLASSDCSNFAGADDLICQSFNRFCKATGNTISSPCTEQSCYSFINDNLTFSACQAINNTCVNVFGEKQCQPSDSCENYSSSFSCTYNKYGKKCYMQSTCITITSQNCKLVSFTGLTRTDCQDYSTSCTLARDGKTCITIANSCQAITELNQCVESIQGKCIYVNAHCININKNSCNQFNTGEAQYTEELCETLNSICIFDGERCLTKTCENSKNQSSFKDCNDWLSSCTYDGISKCVKIQSFCRNQSQQTCYWSTEGECIVFQGACIKKSCETAPMTFLNDQDCSNYLNFCTVGVGGCQTTEFQCFEYVNQDQCFTNSQGGQCYWNKKSSTCQDFTCGNIIQENPFTTHKACYDLKTALKCTINATRQDDGTYLLSGCTPLSVCSKYIIQEQCIIDAEGFDCEWQDTICVTKTCSTASSNYTTHASCQAYLSGCTINYNGYGCVEVSDCKKYYTEAQCIINQKNEPCLWDQVKKVCDVRKCEYAPSTLNDQCQEFLIGCVHTISQCRIKVCEDYFFKTDEECKQKMSSCTSNGINCVTRGICQQAMTEVGCKTQSNDGKDCQWLADGHCVIKSCETAPQTMSTENDCSNYFKGCTPKKNGGCIIKKNCKSANKQDACTQVTGIQCFWDSKLESCRDKTCEDYQSLNSQDCFNLNCIQGLNGYCAQKTNCQKIVNKTICNIGIQGCLWVNNTCYDYKSCTSLPFTNHFECSLASNKCTTNGKNCVAITSCSETTTVAGCVVGYDGTCYFDQTNQKCQKFETCQNIHLQSHTECQQANLNCTTNGFTCIDLTECYNYSYYGCKIGKSIDNIIKKCKWDNGLCRDQKCQDRYGTTDQECIEENFKCVSNQVQCLEKTQCSQYVIPCPTWGTDGKCFTEGQNCRLMKCSDIKNNTRNTQSCQFELSSCVSDGQVCIEKSQCDSYKTLIACRSGGTDGICADSNQGCKRMIECEDANDDKLACDSVKENCFFKSYGDCQALTCESYFKYTGNCTSYLKKQERIFCKIVDNKCKEVNLYKDNCLKDSNYTYTWNSTSQQCQSCQQLQTQTYSLNYSSNCAELNSCLNVSVSIKVVKGLRLGIIMIFYLIY